MLKLIAVFSFCFAIQIQAQSIDTYLKKTDTFLKTHVKNGKVDYSAISGNSAALDELMEMASKIEVPKSEANAYQAFWINTYNLSVIKGIVDNYPLDSPLSVGGFFDGVKYSVGGQSVTLNDIENKMLRKEFNDPRFHFVLVCGAIGCPPLISQAYLPGTLDAQLTAQTKSAILGDQFVQINTKKKRVIGSEILKWYKEDFTMNGSSEIDFLNQYRKEPIPGDYKLSYSTYNWALNQQ